MRSAEWGATEALLAALALADGDAGMEETGDGRIAEKRRRARRSDNQEREFHERFKL